MNSVKPRGLSQNNGLNSVKSLRASELFNNCGRLVALYFGGLAFAVFSFEPLAKL
jgi:hypothetical protein